MITDHVVAHPSSNGKMQLQCMVCNVQIEVRLPIAVDDLTLLASNFEDMHWRCAAQQSPPRHPQW